MAATADSLARLGLSGIGSVFDRNRVMLPRVSDRGSLMVLDPVTRADFPGGELEYTVLTTLWELGTASARELYDRVGEPRGLVYTTIAKILDRQHGKRFVTRMRRGKSFIDKAAVPRPRVDQARAQARVQRLLGDSPRPALAALVDAVESIDPALLDELEQTIAARRRQRDGS